jgi:hypothetical protein
LDSSHGVHRFAPSPTWPPLRPLPPGPSPRLRSGTATFRTRSVLAVPPGFNGFLRRGPDPRIGAFRRLAGLLHPAADRGVHHVSSSCATFRSPATRRRICVAKPFPVANTLRSVPLSGSRTARHHPSTPFEARDVHRTACLSRRWIRPSVPRCHGPDGPSSTSGLSSTGESVAHARRFRRTRLDAPMGFGSNTFRCPPRVWRWIACATHFAARFHAAPASRRPRAAVKAKVLGSSGSGSRCCDRPEGRRPPVRLVGNPKTATFPVRPRRPSCEVAGIGRSASVAPKDVRATPRRIPEGSCRAPEARGLSVPVRLTRRCSVSGIIATPAPKSGGHDPSAQPRKAGTGVRASPGIATRRPKAPRRTPAARRRPASRPKAESVVDAPLASRPDGRSVVPTSTPEGALAGEPHPTSSVVSCDSWLRPLQQAGGPGSGQTDIVSTRSGQTSVDRGLPPTRRSVSRCRSTGSAAGSRATHHRDAFRHRHRSGRAEPGPKSVPGRPEREPGAQHLVPAEAVGDPRFGRTRLSGGVERVDVHVKERFRRTASSR